MSQDLSGPGGRDGGEAATEIQEPPRGSLPRVSSLTSKLIVATAVVVTGGVLVSALFALYILRDHALTDGQVRRAAGERGIQRQMELLARHVAGAVALPLTEGNFTYLDATLQRTVAENPRLTWLVVADAGTNRIVSRAGAAPAGTTLADALVAEVGRAGANQVLGARDNASETGLIFGTRVEVEGRAVGQVRLGASLAELESELLSSLTAARERAVAALWNMVWGAAIVLALAIGAAAWQSARISRPLGQLTHQAARLADGDLSTRVAVTSGDEVGRLAAGFNFMADQLAALLSETASRASLEREMQLARSVQEAMTPRPELVRYGGCTLAGWCEPAAICGGDWWTLRTLPRDRLLVVVGDVTGHGIPSAMVACAARGAVEAVGRLDERLLAPEPLLRAIDAAIRGLEAQHLMTCFVALIDARTGTMEYSNAGHNFPYVLHTDENKAVSDLSVLALPGSPLGHGTELMIRSEKRALTPGDVLVFFSDGVIDRVDNRGQRFGDRRFRSLLRNHHAPSGETDPGIFVSGLRDEILARMSTFAAGQPADDDVTLVVCHYASPTPATESLGRRTGS